MRNYSFSLLLIVITSCSFGNKSTFTVDSPDSIISCTVGEDNGKILYSVTKGGSQIIEPSQLGVNLKNIRNDNLKIINTTTLSFNKTWIPQYGAVSKIENSYNEIVVEVSGDGF